MTLEQLVEQGKAGGALVRVKATGVQGRVSRTSGGRVLVQEGLVDALTWENQDAAKVFPFALHELELVAEREEPVHYPLLLNEEGVDTQDGDPANMYVRAGYLAGMALTLRAGDDDRKMLMRSARSLAFAADLITKRNA